MVTWRTLYRYVYLHGFLYTRVFPCSVSWQGLGRLVDAPCQKIRRAKTETRTKTTPTMMGAMSKGHRSPLKEHPMSKAGTVWAKTSNTRDYNPKYKINFRESILIEING